LKGDNGLNILDIIVILIMAGCIISGAMRGFIRTVLGFASFIIAIFLTNLLYPHVGRFLRGIDGLYTSMSTSISRMLGLESFLEERVGATYNQIISDLPLPAVLRNSLAESYSDTSVANALNATGIDEYISGFLAGLAINVISFVIVLILVFFGIVFLTRALNLIAKLPIIRSLNKLLGGAVGAIWGLLLTWLVLAVVVIYFSTSTNADMYTLLEASAIARPLNEVNFILNFILRFFP